MICSFVVVICVKKFETGGYNMEDIFQVFGDVMGCGPFSFTESLESRQVNCLQAPPPSSFGSVSFNPPNLEAVSSGVGSILQFEQPIMSFDGKRDGNLKYSAGNCQCADGLGGKNKVADNETEIIDQEWQRIRWTDEMVKVLITAVSYFEEVASFDGSESERSHLLTPIKGKWRALSNIMVERGYIVSPQQCEDKFNDLNKKYKRLIQILGTDISYNVVENPALMEPMSIPDETKDEVRKILTCKQLFFGEMYSYHNKNRIFLPLDIHLQHSVVSALKGKVKHCSQDLALGLPEKKRKQGEDGGVSQQVCVHPPQENMFNIFPVAGREQQDLSELMMSRLLQLEEKKLQIQNQMLKLESKKIEWLKVCKQEDEELHEMKLEIEMMKLENERLAFEIKCREIGDVSD